MNLIVSPFLMEIVEGFHKLPSFEMMCCSAKTWPTAKTIKTQMNALDMMVAGRAKCVADGVSGKHGAKKKSGRKTFFKLPATFLHKKDRNSFANLLAVVH